MPTTQEFPLIAVVKREVEDTVRLKVKALSLDEAREKAEQVLSKFPDEHEVEGVSYCYIENRKNLDTETMSVEVTFEE